MVVRLNVLGTEYVTVPITAPTDPTGYGVTFAFPAANEQPADWVGGSWDTSDGVQARCLVGPAGDITLAAGTYDIWVRIAAGVEVILLLAGQLEVYSQPAASLTDAATVKGKLGIPADDTEFDDTITLVCQDVSMRILKLTGRSAGAQTGVEEIHRNWQQGREYLLDLRPVVQVQKVEFRALGNSDAWGSIGFDLLDPDEGAIMVTGILLGWPPIQPYPPAHTRWRAPIYPVVRITYDVADGTQDVTLREAAASWAAFLYDRARAAASSSQQVGQVARELLNESMPSWVTGPLSGYLPSPRFA